MKNYEVTDLFDAGRAGETIEAKECACFDEIAGYLGSVESSEEE